MHFTCLNVNIARQFVNLWVRLRDMPQFVTVGGGYFFLPGVSALRYPASLGN